MLQGLKRSSFPLLDIKIKGKNLVYFDNAASTQKPQVVIDSMNSYYQEYNSNIHRGAHFLANKATEAYELVRSEVAEFVGANTEEIIFTSGTTQSINLLMQSWGRKFLRPDDEIILSEMEHHANLVPWIVLSKEIGFRIRYIPMTEQCTLNVKDLEFLLSERTKLVSVAYISNAMGTCHPIEEIIKLAKSKKALVHIDCAQAIQHISIDVRKMNIDFMSFSAHKVYGPMGTGVFWGKAEHLEAMDPYLFGGEMIKEVKLDAVTFNKIPYKFEAGTPNVANVIGLGAAIRFVKELTIPRIESSERSMYDYFYKNMSEIERLKIYSPSSSISALSFNIDSAHHFDVGQLLDAKGIAIRTGHHCCQPLMTKLGVEGTCRASICFYNTIEEIDYFVSSIKNILKIL